MENNCKSCLGCKHLYSEGDGYSNYTWLETYVRCTKGRNPHMLTDDKNMKPCDWEDGSPEIDNWPVTNDSRCELYAPGKFIEMDVDAVDVDELLEKHGGDILHLREVVTHAGRDSTDRYSKIMELAALRDRELEARAAMKQEPIML